MLRVYLRRPEEEDAAEFVRGTRASLAEHRPWVFPATTPDGFFEYLERIRDERHEGYLVCRRRDRRIVGVVSLSEIVRGALQSAFVGYWGITELCGKGLMSEGLALAFDAAFQVHGLHRLEVNIQPGNLRSIALAKRLGLRKEGFSPQYLKIGGEWRDHERWAVTTEEWERAGGAEMVAASLPKRTRAL